jgi:hypothetical protein
VKEAEEGEQTGERGFIVKRERRQLDKKKKRRRRQDLPSLMFIYYIVYWNEVHRVTLWIFSSK